MGQISLCNLSSVQSFCPIDLTLMIILLFSLFFHSISASPRQCAKFPALLRLRGDKKKKEKRGGRQLCSGRQTSGYSVTQQTERIPNKFQTSSHHEKPKHKRFTNSFHFNSIFFPRLYVKIQKY